MPNGQYTQRQRESLKLWIELIRYSGKLEQIIDDKLRQNFGQNISRFDVLSQLEREQENGLSVGELAGRLIASKGNITGLLDRMQKDGLLTKVAKEEDRRSYIINLSDKGRDLFNQMADNNATWIEEALQSIDLEHMQDFTQFLSKARTSLK
ncbi:MAG: MarR family transcriptional regulator [Kordiimonadaceae bacterium]|jgi:DNA-binding MarR family transcriptional regulator|nr:MarR family transcriptional regulator [Kordiimonadaceae bacterium]MBT6036375.1 MarR family transcriptional regulator [Kordiimonadaceae bacterium]MBT6329818.1 MarR family transcriptional regulator [Kordiimonadaceae bacterium]MBT7582497.1 MarR family transcriptional regulator [Kordiimonadaceae bacterium]